MRVRVRQPGCHDAGELPADRVAVLEGDRCLDAASLAGVRGCDALVLVPGAETPLQSEAIIEFAIDLSSSLAGLVLIEEPAWPGGSAIIHLGEVLAEADEGECELEAEIPTPVPRPDPDAAVPELPPILAQRLAVHSGRRADPGYLADPS